MNDFNRQQIAHTICSLIDDESQRWGVSKLVIGLRASAAIDHLFSAFMEMGLSESELNTDIVRALWVIRNEYPASEPEAGHPLHALHSLVVSRYGEWQKASAIA